MTKINDSRYFVKSFPYALLIKHYILTSQLRAPIL